MIRYILLKIWLICILKLIYFWISKCFGNFHWFIVKAVRYITETFVQLKKKWFEARTFREEDRDALGIHECSPMQTSCSCYSVLSTRWILLFIDASIHDSWQCFLVSTPISSDRLVIPAHVIRTANQEVRHGFWTPPPFQVLLGTLQAWPKLRWRHPANAPYKSFLNPQRLENPWHINQPWYITSSTDKNWYLIKVLLNFVVNMKYISCFQNRFCYLFFKRRKSCF